MLKVVEEKHLVYFDAKKQYFTSYTFALKEKKLQEKEDRDKEKEPGNIQIEDKSVEVHCFNFQIHLKHAFTYDWKSEYYNVKINKSPKIFGHMPFSLDTYFEVLQDPRKINFQLELKKQHEGKQQNLFLNKIIGKLIIQTHFIGNPFILSNNIIESSALNIECIKNISVVIKDKLNEQVICSGTLIDTCMYEEVVNFLKEEGCENLMNQIEGKCRFKCYEFEVRERVSSENICIMKGDFYFKEFTFDKTTIKIYSHKEEVFFISNLIQKLQLVKAVMVELNEPFIIIQNVDTEIQDCHKLIFYTDLLTLQRRLLRSCLYDKVKDKWLIEGIVHYKRNNQHFQETTNKLIQLITDGEELVPLQDDTYYFDEVWKLKARFVYHILSNFKITRDSGSVSLATLIIEESKKAKITSTYLFKKLKNMYMLKNFRTNYEQQFIKSTGINRIFYELINLKRQNKVKIIVRQRSLTNKILKLYNMFRIKIQQNFNSISPIIQRIITKNKFFEGGSKKKELMGPLAVPKSLKCIPYFKGTVTVQTDASDQVFELELREENIIQEKQSITSKIRAPLRKTSEIDKSLEGHNWIMIDTAHIFPAIYKNENVHESVILEKVKKKYDSEQEQIKVLNCISSRDHSANQKLCRALLQKIKINPNAKENLSINVKSKILQILPIFLNKAKDSALWEDYLSLLKLYEPVCHDYSEEGYIFMVSLIGSLTELQFKKSFNYYFEQFHRILLAIYKQNNAQTSEKQEKLKIQIMKSLMKWRSKYCFEILKQVQKQLLLRRFKVYESIQILKVILENIFPYIQSLRIPSNDHLVLAIHQLIHDIIAKDKSQQLFAIKFFFQIKAIEKQMNSLDFLKYVFKALENYREDNLNKYGRAIEALKNVLNRNKKKYGLEIQIEGLNQNQNYFIAQYLWEQMSSKTSLENAFIRLQWIKIYRIFYYYFTPMTTLVKLRQNATKRQFPSLTEHQTREIVQNIIDFFPDVKWFSGYDSRSAKELKAKYEQLNENKRKRKIEEYSFDEVNIMTKFLKENPGRESWDELSREAMRIFIEIFGEKQGKSEGPMMQKYKAIEEGLKKVEQKLKRGRMPEEYSYEKLKDQVKQLLDIHKEEEERVKDIFMMVDQILSEINHEKERREKQQRDEMKIYISLDQIREEEENQENEENTDKKQDADEKDQDDQEFLFGGENEEDDENNGKNQKNKDEDQDLLVFGQQ